MPKADNIRSFGRIRLGWIAAVLMCGAAGACAPSQQSPAPIGPAHIESTQFDTAVKIVGDPISTGWVDGGSAKSLLRTWIDKKTRRRITQLYVVVTYVGSWNFFEMATDDAADVLKASSIDQHIVDCYTRCILSETIGVDLPDALLTRAAERGLPVQLTARSGKKLVIALSADQARRQLVGITAAVAALQ